MLDLNGKRIMASNGLNDRFLKLCFFSVSSIGNAVISFLNYMTIFQPNWIILPALQSAWFWSSICQHDCHVPYLLHNFSLCKSIHFVVCFIFHSYYIHVWHCLYVIWISFIFVHVCICMVIMWMITFTISKDVHTLISIWLNLNTFTHYWLLRDFSSF